MPSRFEIDRADPGFAWDPLIDEVFGELTSHFMEMPRGDGFVSYEVFEKGYEALRKHTRAFDEVTPETVLAAIREAQVALVVFRSILGFTPPEWATAASELTGAEINKGTTQSIDRRARLDPLSPMSAKEGVTADRIRALVEVGVSLIADGAGAASPGVIHRMDKADTARGLDGLKSIASLGAPYPVLLYERFLGRPFASHRDSVSELVGEIVEGAIRDTLSAAGVPYRDTKRVERVANFDQAPDFIIPDEFSPAAVIEAKLTEDDGTARDKVARIQRLATLRDESGLDYEVIACIAGRGFKQRREDMRRLLEATSGKVFTLPTMHLLVDHTRIREYRVG